MSNKSIEDQLNNFYKKYEVSTCDNEGFLNESVNRLEAFKIDTLDAFVEYCIKNETVFTSSTVLDYLLELDNN